MRLMPSGWRLAAVAVVLVLSAGACNRARPRTQPEVPSPPPIPPPLQAHALLVTVDWPPLVAPAPVSAWLAASEEPEAPLPRTRPRPPVPPSDPPPPPPPDEPPGRLGTPETSDVEETTRKVQNTLDRAREELGKVRPEVLDRDARVQYQTVRQLIAQAEEAVKARNFMYAVRLADKAETLARRLAGG